MSSGYNLKRELPGVLKNRISRVRERRQSRFVIYHPNGITWHRQNHNSEDLPQMQTIAYDKTLSSTTGFKPAWWSISTALALGSRGGRDAVGLRSVWTIS